MGFHLTESPYDPYGSGLGPIDQYASPGLGPFPLSPDRLRGLFALMLPPARSFLRVRASTRNQYGYWANAACCCDGTIRSAATFSYAVASCECCSAVSAISGKWSHTQ